MEGLRGAAPGGHGTLSARIMDAIGHRIVAGHYRSGEALPPEAALCDEYRVSRTPLREAVKRLHAKGLVAVGPRAGTRVQAEADWHQLDPDLLRWRFAAGPDAALLGHLYELRAAIEPEACRLAAVHGREPDHAAITAALARMEAVRLDLARTIEADVAFHDAVIAATRNPFMVSVGSAVRLLLGFSFNIRTDRTVIPPAELAQHRRIAEAILARDGEGAAAAMRSLLSESRRSLTAALDRTPLCDLPTRP
jgi:DNA-binding FadR family transcriptional regulator